MSNTTNFYDLNFYYDPENETAMKIYAYEMRKDKNGDWETDTVNDYFETYDFDEEDTKWLLERNETTLDELWIDEWSMSEPKELEQWVGNLTPPKVLEWIKALPEYEYQTED